MEVQQDFPTLLVGGVSVVDMDSNKQSLESRQALIACLKEYRTVFDKYANLKEEKYEKNSNYVQLLNALIPESDQQLFNNFMYWDKTKSAIISEIDPSIKKEVQKDLNRLKIDISKVMTNAEIPTIYREFIQSSRIRYNQLLNKVKGQKFVENTNIKKEIKSLVEHIIGNTSLKETERIIEEFKKYDTEQYENVKARCQVEMPDNLETLKFFKIYRDKSINTFFEELVQYENAIKKFFERYNTYQPSQQEYLEIVKVFDELANFKNESNFLQRALQEGNAINLFGQLNTYIPHDTRAPGRAGQTDPINGKLLLDTIDDIFLNNYVDPQLIRNTYERRFTNIYRIISNYSFMVQFTQKINELSKMQTKIGDLIIQILSSAIMIASYIYDPVSADFGIKQRPQFTVGDQLSWDDLQPALMQQNPLKYDKFNQLVLQLAYNCIESTYGSFLLIIDRYRKRDKTMYALIGSGQQSQAPIKECLQTYILIKRIFTAFSTKMQQYNIQGDKYKFRLQLRQDSKYFQIFILLNNQSVQMDPDQYIAEVNKLWNNASGNVSHQDKIMSERCQNILRDFTDQLMKGLTYDLISLIGEDQKAQISSVMAKTDIQMNTLNDVQKYEPNTDNFPEMELETIQYKGILIDKYLEIANTINKYINQRWNHESPPKDKDYEDQFVEYYKKLYEQYDLLKDTQRREFIISEINKDIDMEVKHKDDKLYKSFGILINQFNKNMQDIMSVFLLYHMKYVEIVSNYARLKEALQAMKYILNKIFVRLGIVVQNELVNLPQVIQIADDNPDDQNIIIMFYNIFIGNGINQIAVPNEWLYLNIQTIDKQEDLSMFQHQLINDRTLINTLAKHVQYMLIQRDSMPVEAHAQQQQVLQHKQLYPMTKQFNQKQLKVPSGPLEPFTQEQEDEVMQKYKGGMKHNTSSTMQKLAALTKQFQQAYGDKLDMTQFSHLQQVDSREQDTISKPLQSTQETAYRYKIQQQESEQARYKEQEEMNQQIAKQNQMYITERQWWKQKQMQQDSEINASPFAAEVENPRFNQPKQVFSNDVKPEYTRFNQSKQQLPEIVPQKNSPVQQGKTTIYDSRLLQYSRLLDELKSKHVIKGGSIRGGAIYANGIPDDDVRYLQQNEPYLKQTVGSRGKEYQELNEMIKMLINLPEVSYVNGQIDYTKFYQYINEYRQHILDEFQKFSSYNDYKQFDYIKYQLEVQTNMAPVFKQIIERKIYQPIPFEKVLEYGKLVRKDYFETIKQTYKIVDMRKLEEGIDFTLVENNLYQGDILRNGKATLNDPTAIESNNPKMVLVGELNTIIAKTSTVIRQNRQKLPQMFVDTMITNGFIQRSMETEEVVNKQCTFRIPTKAIQTPFNVSKIYNMGSQEQTNSYINSLYTKQYLMNYMDGNEYLTDSMKYFIKSTQPDGTNITQEIKRQYLDFFKACTQTGLSLANVPIGFRYNNIQLFDDFQIIQCNNNRWQDITYEIPYVLVAVILAKVMKFIEVPIQLGDIPMDGSLVSLQHQNEIDQFLGRVNADKNLPKQQQNPLYNMFRHILLQSKLQSLRKDMYNRLIHRAYDPINNQFMYMDIPEANIYFNGENKRDPITIYGARPPMIFPEAIVLQQQYIRYVQSVLDNINEANIVRQICENTKYHLQNNSDQLYDLLYRAVRVPNPDVPTEVQINALIARYNDALARLQNLLNVNSPNPPARATQQNIDTWINGIIVAPGALPGPVVGQPSLKDRVRQPDNVVLGQTAQIVMDRVNETIQLYQQKILQLNQQRADLTAQHQPQPVDPVPVNQLIVQHKTDRDNYALILMRAVQLFVPRDLDYIINFQRIGTLPMPSNNIQINNMLKHIPKYPLDCQLGLLQGIGNKKILSNVIQHGAELVYTLDDRQQIIKDQRKVKYFKINSANDFETYMNQIETYYSQQDKYRDPSVLQNTFIEQNIMQMQGCYDIGGNLDTTSPMFFSYPVFISGLITRLILNYDVNVKNKIQADRNQLQSYERYLRYYQLAHPGQTSPLIELLQKITIQLREKLFSNTEKYKLDEYGRNALDAILQANPNGIKFICTIPITSIDLKKDNTQDIYDYTENEMMKDAIKDQLQQQIKAQTDPVIYNKITKLVEPFYSSVIYEDNDADSCIYTSIAASLNNSDEYDWTDAEMFKILLQLPFIKKDLFIFKQRTTNFNVLQSVADTLLQAIDKIIKKGIHIINKLPQDPSNMHNLETLSNEWYIKFDNDNDIIQKFRYLVYQYYYSTDYNVPKINKYAIEKWFRIKSLHDYLNPVGKPGLMENIIANTELYPIFFRLAFVRKIAIDVYGVAKNTLGIDHYYVTTLQPMFIADQPNYEPDLLRYRLGWFNKRDGFKNNIEQFTRLAGPNYLNIVRFPVGQLTLINIQDNKGLYNVMGQFYTFLTDSGTLLPANSIMNEVDIMSGITNPTLLKVSNNIGPFFSTDKFKIDRHGYDPLHRAEYSRMAPQMLAVTPVQFVYQLLYKDFVVQIPPHNQDTFYRFLFSLLNLSPFDPVQLIKQNMTFPLMTILDAYIKKFDSRYPNLVFQPDASRFERVGKINGVDILIQLTPSVPVDIDGKQRNIYMHYTELHGRNYIVRQIDGIFYIYHDIAGNPIAVDVAVLYDKSLQGGAPIPNVTRTQITLPTNLIDDSPLLIRDVPDMPGHPGIIPGSKYIIQITLPNGVQLASVPLAAMGNIQSMVKEMFTILPKLCHKFHSILSQQPNGNYNEYVYKNHGVQSADFDMAKVNRL